MGMNRPAITALNLCLAGITCLLALKVYGIWHNTPASLPTVVEEASVNPYTPRRQFGTKARKPNETYNIIVEKNLFSRNRGYNEGTESLIPPSEITLYGTFILGQYKAALLKVQEEEKRGVRRRKTIKVSPNKNAREVTVGNTIAGYRVTDILEDRVILENGAGKSYVVALEVSKERSHVRTNVSKAGKRARVSKRRAPRRTTTRSGRARGR